MVMVSYGRSPRSELARRSPYHRRSNPWCIPDEAVLCRRNSKENPFETIGDGDGSLAGRIRSRELQEYEAGSQREESQLQRTALQESLW